LGLHTVVYEWVRPATLFPSAVRDLVDIVMMTLNPLRNGMRSLFAPEAELRSTPRTWVWLVYQVYQAVAERHFMLTSGNQVCASGAA
jgi:hypothetical protein